MSCHGFNGMKRGRKLEGKEIESITRNRSEKNDK